MNDQVPVLQFDHVTVESRKPNETGLWDISFALKPGELLLVQLEKGLEQLPLADAAEGLLEPSEGTVCWFGEDWQNMSVDRGARERGRIGRVFQNAGWLSDMEVDENILLAQKHHSTRPEREIMEEALKLTRMFGLPGLPRGLPSQVLRRDLHIAACVRAFLGEPALLILEEPTQGVYVDIIGPLVNAVQSRRKRGGAVLWTTSELPLWNNPGLRPTARAKMSGAQLHFMEG